MTTDTPPDEFSANLTASTVRRFIASEFGKDTFEERDTFEALGYPKNPDYDVYERYYLRGDIASVIVDAPAKTTFKERPVITDDADDSEETPFEKRVNELFDDHGLLEAWTDTDRLNRIGHFACLVLGARDGRSLSEPLDSAKDLAYLTPVSEAAVESFELDRDPESDRFGLPDHYIIDFSHGESALADLSLNSRVHWTRVIHVAEDALGSKLIGRPALEKVLNQLINLEKIIGAGGEAAWRGIDYGLLLKAAEGATIDDPDAVEDEVMAYLHGLQPFLRTQNMDVERLGGEDIRVEGITEPVLQLIAGATGIPKRVLTGSERGELASTQDKATWLGRVAERQVNFAEPHIARATIDRFIDVGIVPPPMGGSYDVEWPDLFELNEIERAEVVSLWADSLKELATALTMSDVFAPEEVRQVILGWSPIPGHEVMLTPEEQAELDRLAEELADDAGLPEDDPDVDDQFEETRPGADGEEDGGA